MASASITGPTWVARSRGSPSLSSRAAPATMSNTRSATSSCTHNSRSAEQRWPAERNADAMTSSVTCSGNAVASTIMALMPPVSAISGGIGPSFAASARLMMRATSVEPVKTTPATRRSAVSMRADFAIARHQMKRTHWYSGRMQQLHRLKGDERRLLGGFRHDTIAGGQRAGNLANENRQRKIPWADANKHAAPAIMQFVALACRARQRLALKSTKRASLA